MKRTIPRYYSFFVFLLIFFCCQIFPAIAQSTASELKSKRILFIDSYHQGYSWVAGIVAGARSVLEAEGIEMEVYSMDTKRNPDIGYIKQSALKAKAKIEAWKPDLIIVSDDNASKYLIEPYYKNVELPIVFCGVNWDASVYGYPYNNATGMEEVSLIEPLPKELARHARGTRLGILSGTVISDRKNVKNYKEKAGIIFDKTVFVENAEQWREAYLEMQNEVDILIIENSMSISGWKNDDMHQFIMDNTRIPTGTTQRGMIPYVLLGYLQVPEEQGQYAAKIAIDILNGQSPGSIPIVNNTQAYTSVNLDLAEKMNIIFELTFLRNVSSYRWKQ